jgi:hypothetical protein
LQAPGLAWFDFFDIVSGSVIRLALLTLYKGMKKRHLWFVDSWSWTNRIPPFWQLP